MEEDEAELCEIVDLLADSPKGAILDVDLKYSEELYERHNPYPLMPEHMVFQKEWMSLS